MYATYNLGYLLFHDQGGPKDEARGRSLIERAAAHGSDIAKRWLAANP